MRPTTEKNSLTVESSQYLLCFLSIKLANCHNGDSSFSGYWLAPPVLSEMAYSNRRFATPALTCWGPFQTDC